MKNALRHLFCVAAIVAVIVTSTSLAAVADHQTAQTRPIKLGTSGGNIFDRSTLYCCSGTLGALVQDAAGIQHILSNNHVLGRANQAQAGDPVNQPGMIDQNCLQDGTVANFTRLVEIKFGKGRTMPLNEVDAAIAQVVAGTVSSDGAILGIGSVSAETAAASVGQSVQKSGRTTGHTFGSVSAIDVTIDVGYSAECGGAANQKARFVNQILITPGTFSAGGDSGSVIFETGTTPRAVGLLFAGSSSHTIANPINRVLSLLNVSMVGGPPVPPTVGTLAGTVTDATTGTAIAGATVATDSGQSATTANDGTYSLVNVPSGSRVVTAAATGYATQSASVNVLENQTTTQDFALPAVVSGSRAIVQCVTYTTQGGKNNDKDLLITITVVDDVGVPVTGAQANIAVTLNGSPFGAGTGATTGGSGQATYTIRNAANGTYATTVTAVSKAGLSFEGSTPANAFRKGADSSPEAFCLAAAASVVGQTAVGLEHARNVKARHADALLELEDVVGHGISRNDDGETIIEVYLANENANARARIPARLENVPVRVVVTGAFMAY